MDLQNKNKDYFKSKYIKYKAKYIGLLEQVQSGGDKQSDRSRQNYINSQKRSAMIGKKNKQAEQQRLDSLSPEERKKEEEQKILLRKKQEEEYQIKVKERKEETLQKYKEEVTLLESEVKDNVCGLINYTNCRIYKKNIDRMNDIISDLNKTYNTNQDELKFFNEKLQIIINKQKECKCIF